jgi:hypothetical protein
MEEMLECPLSDSELELAKAIAATEDHSDENLARLSRFKASSVKTMCRNMMNKLYVYNRSCIPLRCARKGWVPLPPETVEEIEGRDRQREIS